MSCCSGRAQPEPAAAPARLGWGLPAAIGACYATKKNQIICLTGEGGLQLNVQELATVMHYNLPIKIFIYNNGGYLTIKQTQQMGFNNRIMGKSLSLYKVASWVLVATVAIYIFLAGVSFLVE